MTNFMIAAYLSESKVFSPMGINPILENIAARYESARDCFASKGLRMTHNFDSKT